MEQIDQQPEFDNDPAVAVWGSAGRIALGSLVQQDTFSL